MARTKEGPYGGDGGEPVSLDYFSSISRICVAYTTQGTSGYFNSITIYYEVHGVPNHVKWGGGGGTPEEFKLDDGEYIKSVNGYYGGPSEVGGANLVRELTFVTSKTSHKIGIHDSACKDFKLPKNKGTIVGFHGRAETLIDALGAYIEDGRTGGATSTGF